MGVHGRTLPPPENSFYRFAAAFTICRRVPTTPTRAVDSAPAAETVSARVSAADRRMPLQVDPSGYFEKGMGGFGGGGEGWDGWVGGGNAENQAVRARMHAGRIWKWKTMKMA